MKYEEILIADHKKLSDNKMVLVKKLARLCQHILRVKELKKKFTEVPFFQFKAFCMLDKVTQFDKLTKRIQQEMLDLGGEYANNEEKLRDIEDTLFKYYDKKIEETVLGLGIDGIDTAEALLGWGSQKK